MEANGVEKREGGKDRGKKRRGGGEGGGVEGGGKGVTLMKRSHISHIAIRSCL